MDKNKIFVFSIIVNPEDDILNTNVVYKACTERIKKFFPSFYIFTPADKLYKEALEKYSDFLKDEKLKIFPSIIADIVRMYILSKLQNALYVDLDIWLTDISFVDKLGESPVLPYNWGIIYSGMNNRIFNKVLDFYDVNTIKNCKPENVLDNFCDYILTSKLEPLDNQITTDTFNTYHYHSCIIQGILGKCSPNDTLVFKRFDNPDEFFKSVNSDIKQELWFYKNGNIADIPVTDISNYKLDYGQAFYYFNDKIWKDYQELKDWLLNQYEQSNKPNKIIIDF